MFIAALLVISRNWKKFKCLSTGELKNKLNGILLIKKKNNIKQNKIPTDYKL